jgi:hypothetical protein
MKTAVLVGTSHKYELPDIPSSAKFRRFIERVCSANAIRSIAEEMSIEALQQTQALESTCEIVANSRGIPHKYCDPNNDKRSRLGIRGETDIRLQGFHQDWDEDSIEAAVRVSHQIREAYWLRQILALDVWPALFVCGANHVGHFADLLKEHGINTEIAASDWEP